MIHDLTPDERQLAEFMSEISEKCYGAGWEKNSEYVLWDAVISGPRNFGQDTITQADIDELIKISNKSNAWIVFDDEREEIAIPLNKWRIQFTDNISKDPSILHW
jgi:hypothetical protein